VGGLTACAYPVHWLPELPNPLLHTQLELEARVGIGRFTSCFEVKNMRFRQQKQQTLALPRQSGTNPVTEGFTETFTEGFSRHSRAHFKQLILFAPVQPWK